MTALGAGPTPPARFMWAEHRAQEAECTAGSGLRLFPQPFEPMPGNAGVMRRVLGISVAEVILHRSQISALIGQVVAAGMAQHVRPDAPELCGLASDPHDIMDGLAGHRLGRITLV
jgi:hypothetical protein